MSRESDLLETSQQAQATSPNRWRLCLFRLGAIVLGVVIALGMLEFAARLFLYRYGNWIDRLHETIAKEYGGELTLRDLVKPSANKQRCYELVPGAWGTFVGQPVKMNSAGFRDREHTINKPPDTFRVAVLGDSIAFGWGVKQEERFTEVLEVLLNSTRSTTQPLVECLNFGIPGYNSVMEEALLRDVVLAYSPDVVVVNLVTNDDEAPNFIRLEPQVWALDRLFLLEAVRDRLVGRPLGDTARLLIGGVAEAGGRGHGAKVVGYRPELVPPEYRFLVGWENMSRALKNIAELSRSHHAKPWCLLHYDGAALREAVRGNPQWRQRGENWRKAALEAGFPIVESLVKISAFAVSHKLDEKAFMVSDTDEHPSPLAHRLIAESLAEALRPALEQWRGQ